MQPRRNARYTVNEGASPGQNQVEANSQFFNRAFAATQATHTRARGSGGGISDARPARNQMATPPLPLAPKGTDQAHFTIPHHTRDIGLCCERETARALTEPSRLTVDTDANARRRPTGEGQLTFLDKVCSSISWDTRYKTRSPKIGSLLLGLKTFGHDT